MNIPMPNIVYSGFLASIDDPCLNQFLLSARAPSDQALRPFNMTPGVCVLSCLGPNKRSTTQLVCFWPQTWDEGTNSFSKEPWSFSVENVFRHQYLIADVLTAIGVLLQALSMGVTEIFFKNFEFIDIYNSNLFLPLYFRFLFLSSPSKNVGS